MLLSEELKNTVKNFIDEKLEPNNWVGTCMENYHKLPNKSKGDVGELIVSELMKKEIVLPSINGYNSTDDRLISGYDTEIKISLTQKGRDNQFIINHIKSDIKWDRFIFYGMNHNKNDIFVWCTKSDMEECMKLTNWWCNQSSPEEKMCTGKNVMKWVNSPYTRDIKTWGDEVKSYKGLQEFMSDVAE